MSRSALWLLVFAMVAFMIASVFYPLPGGGTIGFWGFVQLWLRELILLGILLFALILGLFAKSDEPKNDHKQDLQR